MRGFVPHDRQLRRRCLTGSYPHEVTEMIAEAYVGFATPVIAAYASPPLTTKESDVAEAVWLAATDNSGRLRYPAGADAVALAQVA